MIEDELLEGLTLSTAQARLDLAIGLLTEGAISRRQATRIGGVTPIELLKELRRRGVPVHYDTDDLAADLRAIENWPAS